MKKISLIVMSCIIACGLLANNGIVKGGEMSPKVEDTVSIAKKTLIVNGYRTTPTRWKWTQLAKTRGGRWLPTSARVTPANTGYMRMSGR